jgi:hypothetical protein
MGRRLDQRELRRRTVESVRDQVEAFGSAHSDSVPIRHPGLLAAIYERLGFRDLGFLETWELRR